MVWVNIDKILTNKQRIFYLTKGDRHDIINKSLRGEPERDEESQKNLKKISEKVLTKRFRRDIIKMFSR